MDMRHDMVDGVLHDVEEGRAYLWPESMASPPEQCMFDELFTSRTLLILEVIKDMGYEQIGDEDNNL